MLTFLHTAAPTVRFKPSAILVVLLGCLVLGGCTTADQTKLGDNLVNPLSDLNLINAAIPEVLQAAKKAPYTLPAPPGCDTIAAHVKQLDEVLGADFDTPQTDKNPSLIERTGGAVVNAAGRSINNLVPFRSWVRKLTGAERYSKQVAAAIAAGAAQRAFLKGAAKAMSCTHVAPA